MCSDIREDLCHRAYRRPEDNQIGAHYRFRWTRHGVHDACRERTLKRRRAACRAYDIEREPSLLSRRCNGTAEKTQTENGQPLEGLALTQASPPAEVVGEAPDAPVRYSASVATSRAFSSGWPIEMRT